MTRFDLRLAFRLNRFEIVVLGLLIGVVGVAAVVVAGNLDATGYGATCLGLNPDQPMPPSCESAGRAFYDLQNKQASPVQSLLIVLPFLLAVARRRPAHRARAGARDEPPRVVAGAVANPLVPDPPRSRHARRVRAVAGRRTRRSTG